MAKSNARLDREIEAVMNEWNQTGSVDPNDRGNQIASAVYHTLCWARGMREEFPLIRVRKALEKAKEAPNG